MGRKKAKNKAKVKAGAGKVRKGIGKPRHAVTVTITTKPGAAGTVAVAKAALRRGPARDAKIERKIVAAILPCADAAMISARSDEAELADQLRNIAEHRQKYEDRVARAPALSAKGNVTEMQGVPAHKAKITEAKGEREATLLVVQQYAAGNGDFLLRSGFSAGVGIDQIWYSSSTDTFMLVEAKGPGATLSTAAAKGDQMSKQWVRNSLNSIVSSPSCTSSEKADANRMLAAMDGGPPPKVIGRVIEALPGGGACERGCPDKGIYHAT